MDWDEVLELSGAWVRQFQKFGDHEGLWLALVTYGQETYWLTGYWGKDDEIQDAERCFPRVCFYHQWDPSDDCNRCELANEHFETRAHEIGRRVLEGKQRTYKQVKLWVKQEANPSPDPKTMLTWLKEHREVGII